MKITPEVVTVLADPIAGEINLILAGLRITLSLEESTALVGGLARSVDQLRLTARPDPRSSDAAHASAGKEDAAGHIVAPVSSDAESMQLRTRALIQASIRDKGLNLREDTRT